MATAVAKADPRELNFGSIKLTSTGITSAKRVTYEQWEAAGSFINRCDEAIQWWVGDWLNLGEDNEQKWGDKYQQAISMFGLAHDTLRQYAWVARNVTKENRRDDLSWNHHMQVADLPPEKQTDYLAKAAPDGPHRPPAMSTRELKALVAGDPDKARNKRKKTVQFEASEPDESEASACPNCGYVLG